MDAQRSGRWFAWVLAAVAGGELAVVIGMGAASGMPAGDVVGSYLLTNAAIGVSFAGCGAILAVQRPGNAVGWLLLAAGLAPLTSAALTPTTVYGAAHGWPDGTLRLLLTVFGVAWPWGVGLFIPLALQVFPDGRPRWRWLLGLTVVTGILFGLAMMAGPDPETLAGRVIAPYHIVPSHGLAPLWAAASAVPLLAQAGAIAALAVRYRTGDERVRRQLLWLVLAAIVAIAVNLPRWVIGDGPILLLLAIPLVPVAITIAILRHRLLDIRLVVSRTLLYLLLSVAVAVAYAGLVVAFDALLRGVHAPVLATLLIALLFNPARVRLQRGVDRMLYGARSDPVRAVSKVGERLAADDLSGVLAGAREALRLPYAALRHDGRELAATGEPPAALHTVALSLRGARVGELVVGVRHGETRLGSADIAVLDLLAAPLAAALHASALAEAVQAARERLVAAREEERRRLHRDLHDGLGPALTGLGFKADAAHNLVASGAGIGSAVGTDPQRAAALLVELRGDIRDAIDDVRRLIYGLRPPALDELGLAGALRRHCAALPIAVTVEAPDPLPPLPAAVEVAVYRIATEALTNVTRHAGATAARVELQIDSEVRVCVTDDGRPGSPWVAGVGLTSIRERAVELGGRCTAGPTAAGGRVAAQLPLAVHP